MFCGKCGTKADDDQQFCKVCGAQLTPEEAGGTAAPEETKKSAVDAALKRYGKRSILRDQISLLLAAVVLAVLVNQMALNPFWYIVIFVACAVLAMLLPPLYRKALQRELKQYGYTDEQIKEKTR